MTQLLAILRFWSKIILIPTTQIFLAPYRQLKNNPMRDINYTHSVSCTQLYVCNTFIDKYSTLFCMFIPLQLVYYQPCKAMSTSPQDAPHQDNINVKSVPVNSLSKKISLFTSYSSILSLVPNHQPVALLMLRALFITHDDCILISPPMSAP